MRAVIQRVKSAAVSVDAEQVSRIGKGLLVLLGVGTADTCQSVSYITRKICGMRIFSDGNGKMNWNLSQVGGSVLLVSQFTLYGDASHGNRPSFIDVMPPERARELYELAVQQIAQSGIPVQTGVFGADMQVDMCGDGPVTIVLDTEKVK